MATKKILGVNAKGKQVTGVVNASNIMQAIGELSNWKKTHKKLYDVYICKPPVGTQVTNALEGTQYVTDAQNAFVISGTQGETFVTDEGDLTRTYDCSRITKDKFTASGYLDWTRVTTRPDSVTNWAFPVPRTIANFPVQTSSGDILYANRTGVKHGYGDFLVCSDAGGRPNLQDVWVVNGLVFANTYDLHNFSDDVKNSTKNTNTPVPVGSLIPKYGSLDIVTRLVEVVSQKLNTDTEVKYQVNLANVDTYKAINVVRLNVRKAPAPGFKGKIPVLSAFFEANDSKATEIQCKMYKDYSKTSHAIGVYKYLLNNSNIEDVATRCAKDIIDSISNFPESNDEFAKLKELARKLAESLRGSYTIVNMGSDDSQGYIRFDIDNSKKPKVFVIADFFAKSENPNNFGVCFTLMVNDEDDCEELDARRFEQSKTGSSADFIRKSKQAIDNLFGEANSKDLDTLYDGIAFTREVMTQLTALFKYEGLSSDLESDWNVHYHDNVKYKLHLGWLGSLAKDSTGRDSRTSDSVVIYIKYDADTKKIVYSGRHKGKELKNEFVDISNILELQNEVGTADFSMGYVVVLIMYLTICKEMNITPYRFITKAPYLHAVSAYVNNTADLNFLESAEKVRIAVNNKTIQSEYNKENSVASTKYMLGIFYGKDTSPKYTYECRVNVRLNKQMILKQISEYKKCIEGKGATVADVERCLSECSFKGTLAVAYGKVIDLELPSGSYIPYFAHSLQEAILSEWRRQKGTGSIKPLTASDQEALDSLKGIADKFQL